MWLAGLATLATGLVLAAERSTRGRAYARPPIWTTTHAPAPAAETVGTLRVLTLNLAHGRCDRFHQALLDRDQIEDHLLQVSRLLQQVQPDVVAVQEADGPSVWSGGFDHVRFVAQESGFHQCVRGENVSGLRLAYGTGLLAQHPLIDAETYTFAPSPPTLNKGFLLATTRVPCADAPGGVLEVDVVSVHLDFARSSVRAAQVQALIDCLQSRARPLVVMGDFNCQWTDADGHLQRLAEELDLQAHAPDDNSTATFRTLDKRLDWILVSPELTFTRYETLPDVVSDHAAVLAELAYAGS